MRVEPSFSAVKKKDKTECRTANSQFRAKTACLTYKRESSTLRIASVGVEMIRLNAILLLTSLGAAAKRPVAGKLRLLF
jgi:hypothetical protein